MTNSAASGPQPAVIEVGKDGAARNIAVRARAGGAPGLFWLGGFNSDMQGTKAIALDAWAADHGRGCVRFDYSGHGESGGAFIDGTVGRWLEESVAVFEQFCRGPQVVIGSSAAPSRSDVRFGSCKVRRTPMCPGSTPLRWRIACQPTMWC